MPDVDMRDLDEASFRAALRDFIRDHAPTDQPGDADDRLAQQRRWAATMHDHGWAAPTWPRRWGGMELPRHLLVPYHEELALARVPSHPSPNAFIVGPTILAHGTDWQRDRFLLPIVRAEELWCQGFSEPGAGSDLPSLTTRARREGDGYVVNGQKVWTTRAMTADWMFALVRTGAPDSGRHGLTYLLLPMDSPGLTVRPLRDMTGGTFFGEVFFDDVEVPVRQRVGEEDDGWRVARTSLGHERSTSRVSQVIRYRRIADELVELARRRGRLHDPVLRARLTDVLIGARLLGMTFERIAQRVVAGGDPGPASSVSRLFLATYEQRLHEIAMEVLGTDALLSPDEAEDGKWIWGFLNTRASTIGAGTAEIQRNTLADRVLGLPRG